MSTPNDLVRDQYVMQVAGPLRAGSDQLRPRSHERCARGRCRCDQTHRRVRTTETAEVVALRLLVHRWDETAPFLSEALFTDAVTLDAFRASRSPTTAAGTRSNRQVPRRPTCSHALISNLTKRVHSIPRSRSVISSRASPNGVSPRSLAGPDRPTDVGDVRRLIEEAAEGGAGSDAAAQLLGWIEGHDEER